MKPLPEVRSLYRESNDSSHEAVATLLSGGAFRCEHIESHGDASPPDFWYDQDDSEWVALVKGSAELEFEMGSLSLRSGDHLLIPAHLKHRVASTSSDAVWLAIHFRPSAGKPGSDLSKAP